MISLERYLCKWINCGHHKCNSLLSFILLVVEQSTFICMAARFDLLCFDNLFCFFELELNYTIVRRTLNYKTAYLHCNMQFQKSIKVNQFILPLWCQSAFILFENCFIICRLLLDDYLTKSPSRELNHKF